MSPRIAVVGSLNLDLVVQATRLPAPGETLLGGPLAMLPGGKGANQAVAAARLGAATAMIGCVGDDPFGARLVAALREHGVDTSRVRATARAATGTASITVAAGGENTIVVDLGANAALAPADVAAAAGVDAVVAQLEVPLAAVEAAAATGAGLFVLNAAPAHPLPAALLARVDVLVVNEIEARALGGDGDGEALARAALELGPRAVALTLGARGAIWLDRERCLQQPAFAVEPVDTVGAGDAFVAALTVALVEGRDPAAALRFACAAGALATTRAGAQAGLPSRAEVDARCA